MVWAWCNTENAGNKRGQSDNQKALTLFSGHPVTHRAALDLLPTDSATGDNRYCTSRDCVFNRERPGHPASVSVAAERLCLWCDPVLLRKRCAAEQGLKQVRAGVSVFREKDDMVYRRALCLLPKDYCHTTVRKVVVLSARDVQVMQQGVLMGVIFASGTMMILCMILQKQRRAASL